MGNLATRRRYRLHLDASCYNRHGNIRLTRPALQATLRAMQGVSLGGVSFSAPTEGKIASGIDVADILVMTHNGRMLR